MVVERGRGGMTGGREGGKGGREGGREGKHTVWVSHSSFFLYNLHYTPSFRLFLIPIFKNL